MKTPLERFEEHYIPEPNSGCWIWISAVNSGGYGSFGWNGKIVSAHHASWLLHRGDRGQAHVLHRCDNPACVNPDHLFLGDNAANVADRVAKGRSGTGRGEAGGLAKLTNEEVRAIVADQRYQREIAASYGVAFSTIAKIKRGETWSSVTNGARDRRGRNARHLAKITAADAIKIREDPRSQTAIAVDYGISQSAVSLIKRRVNWRDIP